MTIKYAILTATSVWLLVANACLAQTVIDDSLPADNTVTLKFYQTDVSIILQALADSQHLNLVMADNIEQKQTIRLDEVDWNKALMIILKSANLQAEIDDNILFVKTSIPLENAFDEMPEHLELVTININHANLNDLLALIKQQGFISEKGNASVDLRTHTLIVRESKEQIEAIRHLVKQLDKPIPQIHISAHIVTMSQESLSELGIKWGYQGRTSQFIDKFSTELATTSPAAALGFNLAKRSGSLLNLELSALESENQLEIIASPNLLTANHNMASIKQGTEIPYEVSSGSNGATAIEFKQAVLGLEVTPQILSNDQIILDLYITQNTAGKSIKRSDGGESLAIDTQEVKTQVLVKSGETVILGGIFQQQNTKQTNRVPQINKIPIIGNLFKNNEKNQKKRELVIFITPQLVE